MLDKVMNKHVFVFTGGLSTNHQMWEDVSKKLCVTLRATNLSFEVALPLGCLQSFEASAAVRRH